MNTSLTSLLAVAAVAIACVGCNKGATVDVDWVSTSPKQAWQQHPASEIKPEATDSTIVIDTALTQQTIDGFGACFNELGWTSLSMLPQESRDSILTELFSPEGANLCINRMPVAANDFATDWYSYDEVDGDFDLEHFSIDRDTVNLIPFIMAAKQVRPDFKLWASPWSPPTWMKVNRHYASNPHELNGMKPEQKVREGENGFIVDDRYLDAYARYFGKFIDAYRDKGIEISMVMPQNENNSDQIFPSCTWQSSALTRFIGKHLGPEMEKRGVEIYYGTMERPNAAQVDTALTDADASKYIKGVGFQWAGKAALPVIHANYPGLKLFETEQECGNGRNDWSHAWHAWDLMKHYLGNGVNVYDYWNISLLNGGVSRWGWTQNSLVSVDGDNGTYVYNPEYYMLKHLSHYVKPGAKYVELSGTYADAMAFVNPDGSVAVIVANPYDHEFAVALDLNGATSTPTLAPASINTFLLSPR